VTTILAATDFSPTADHALDHAIELARAVGARIELMHVHTVQNVPMPPTLDVLTVTPRPEAVAEAEVALAARVERVQQAGVECSANSTFGAPADELVRRAREIGARWLAIGRHGHRAVTELLVGSVAMRVVRQAPCVVLVVPPR
jgi:nucleotide-binding universal stress UspA family protein